MCTQPIIVTYSARLNKRGSDDIRVKGKKHSILCSCGKCEECLKQYQNDWMCRIYSEMKSVHIGVFFTLTYDDDSVPCVYDQETGERYTCVDKDEVKRFLKNMREDRRKKGKSTDYKWFLTSEYGPTTLRAHYHCVLTGISLKEVLPYLNRWSREKGFVTYRELAFANSKSLLNTLRYTAKYCAKGDFENPLVSKGVVPKNFHLISKSIGKDYLTDAQLRYFRAVDFPCKRDSDGSYSFDYLEEISKRLCYVIPPCSYHLPRYYREVVFEKRKDLQIAYQDFVCDRLLEINSPTLVRLLSEKSYRSLDETSRQGVREDAARVLRDIRQRKSDSRKSVVNNLKKSKI